MTKNTEVTICPNQKFQAIRNLPIPKTKAELMSFLGLVKTLNNYTPFISQVSNTLQKLTHLATHFHWDSQAQKEFNQLEEVMTKHLLINAFDPSKTIHLYCDAAQSRGLGFILLQPTDSKEVPFNLIQCGSTHLSEIQPRYSTY